MGLKTSLSRVLTPSELKLLSSAYDVVGDIVVLRIHEALHHRSTLIAETIMQKNRHVKTVLCRAGPVVGPLRLRRLRWVRGEEKTETLHREWGCVFKVDLAKCYFSPRLSYERARVADLVRPCEVVVNMFAGVGCFSIIMVERANPRKVYSIDINSDAVQYMKENIKLNRVDNVVVPIEGDAKKVIEKNMLSIADRVLMPLPEKAHEYLEYAVSALKPEGGWVHYYGFEHAARNEDPIEKVKDKVSQKMRRLNLEFEIPTARIVRPVGPRWFQVVLDILVHGKA